MVKNIVFSTTRQWNPGDEFILAGVRRIFARVGLNYNAIIFNRNPDVRSCFQDRQLFKTSHINNDFVNDISLIDIEANFKFGFFDNSLKPNTDCGFVDWVVLAGTPEWCSGRMADLYSNILRHNIPVLILGVGGGCDIYHESFRDVIAKAKALTVRDQGTLEAVEAQGFRADFLPCPALLSAPDHKQRHVEMVAKIALIFHASRRDSVNWNGFSDDAYTFTIDLYAHLLGQWSKHKNFEISFVCHYIDEIPLAKAQFPDHDVLYSYESSDYYDIYAQFDFVIGPRVHGIGVAASMGIPGVAIAHDARGRTTEGFLAEIITPAESLDAAIAKIDNALANVADKSQRLRQHKEETLTRYAELVARALQDRQVEYSSSWDFIPSKSYALGDLRPLAAALEAIKFGQPLAQFSDAERMQALAPEIRERLINIEHKVNHLMKHLNPNLP